MTSARPGLSDASALSAAVGRLPIHAVRRRPGTDLDGRWQFQLLASHDRELSDEWDIVAVPGLWTMDSREDPAHYTNVPMPFDEAPPTVPSRNPVGVYRRHVRLELVENRRTILHVGAAEGHLRVVVNGALIGSSTDSHLEAEFDISDAVVDGDNVIELRVAKWSAQSYLEDQDQWWHSGISRSVFLYDVPPIRIADVIAVADYDADAGTGSLRVDVETEGIAQSWNADGWSVEVTALDGTRTTPVPVRQAAQGIPRPGRDRTRRPEPRLPPDFMDLLSIRAAGSPVPQRFAAVAERFAQTVDHGGAPAGVARDERTDLVVSPWSAESPHLETIHVALLDPAGAVVDEVSVRVGFRRVEIVGRDLLINKRRILIQGVNRHDIDPQTGRVLSRERMRAELTLLKQFNVNAIRAAHYPNDPYLLDLCDEFGLYVIDEADIEGHAFAGILADDPRFLAAFHERFSRMVVRDRNHPSIIAWSLGNETGYGAAHDSLAAWSRHFDPTRPVHYEGAISTDWHGGRAATDIVCPMYPSYESLKAYSADSRADRPLILCEYAYSQGNSSGGFTDYWDLFESLPGLQGGFIWQFLDHALDPDGNGRGRYGGDFGDAPNDGYVLLNGIAFSDLTPKPAFFEIRSVFAPIRLVSDFHDVMDGVVRIRNRRTFAPLDDLVFEVTVEGGSGTIVTSPLTVAHVAAGEEAALDLPEVIMNALRSSGALALSVTARTEGESPWAPAGTELVTQQVSLPRVFDTLSDTGNAPALDEAGDVTSPLLVSAPRLSLWRALTDNDESFALDDRFVRSGFFALTPTRVHTDSQEEAAEVQITYRTAYGDEVHHRRTVTALGPADWVFEEHVILPDGTEDGVRVGMEFILTRGFDSASWVGLGPWENYPDRREGALLGRWESCISELAVPYLYPQHNGTRGGVSSLGLAGSPGTVTVAGDRELHMTVARHTGAELEAATHWWMLPNSDVTVVNLDVAHRGVGMARLGPDVRPRHRLSSQEYTWRWRLTLEAR
jgi:beta-galactosidase